MTTFKQYLQESQSTVRLAYIKETGLLIIAPNVEFMLFVNLDHVMKWPNGSTRKVHGEVDQNEVPIEVTRQANDLKIRPLRGKYSEQVFVVSASNNDIRRVKSAGSINSSIQQLNEAVDTGSGKVSNANVYLIEESYPSILMVIAKLDNTPEASRWEEPYKSWQDRYEAQKSYTITEKDLKRLLGLSFKDLKTIEKSQPRNSGMAEITKGKITLYGEK